MDKNTIIGLVLMAAVLIGFSWYNTNQERNLQSDQTEQTTTQKAADNKQQSTADKAPLAKATADSTDIFYAATKEQKTAPIELKNQKVTVKINAHGGAISEVRLNEYKSYKDFEAKKENPLLLYSAKDAGLNFKLDTKEGTLDFSDYYFTPINQTDSTTTW